MEGIFFETLAVEFGVAFTCVLILIAVATGIILAGMAEAERKGARLVWAEWPITETVEAAPPAEKVRLAA